MNNDLTYQHGVITVAGQEYRVYNGNTVKPVVYVCIRHQGWRAGFRSERLLNPNGATALRVVSAFRRATRGDPTMATLV